MDRRLTNLRTEVKLKIIPEKVPNVYMFPVIFFYLHEALKSKKQAVWVTSVVVTFILCVSGRK